MQMFAPLLEPGNVRDGFVVLMDPAGNYRKFGLRIGMFMADIPEICRQLGNFVVPVICRYVPLQDMYLADVCWTPAFFDAGVLNSVLTTYPCYKCLAPKDMMHDFSTPFHLRHTGLIEYHVKEMRRLLRTRGVAARNDYREYMSGGCHIDV
jgi:hypothetical protein